MPPLMDTRLQGHPTLDDFTTYILTRPCPWFGPARNAWIYGILGLRICNSLLSDGEPTYVHG